MAKRKPTEEQPTLPAVEERAVSLDTVLRGLAKRMLDTANLVEVVFAPAACPVIERQQFEAIQRHVDEARTVVLGFETIVAAVAYQSGYRRTLKEAAAHVADALADALKDVPEAELGATTLKVLAKYAKEGGRV